jgi:hypothetical protein
MDVAISMPRENFLRRSRIRSARIGHERRAQFLADGLPNNRSRGSRTRRIHGDAMILLIGNLR